MPLECPGCLLRGHSVAPISGGCGPDQHLHARGLKTLSPAAPAAQSNRVQRPVYHIALSFDPEKEVDRETMIRVADRLLADLELTEHQALIVAHGDTRHAHVHLMVNRVPPRPLPSHPLRPAGAGKRLRPRILVV
ncbi:MAG TPA: relaxase/mobilization nuclease domain-containing protein [Gemmatimonadota bacterium]|nr:relaxase/mobilization nuclease domain-containing protein [Gemmatimonadota bacterium]